ncbi:hypothetical protein BC833DRAFT_574520 [Globomyces pollinis-pini]|nr:hypothetical protein BC833DRAFT_574520 [Globomyces pollinis-pini]
MSPSDFDADYKISKSPLSLINKDKLDVLLSLPLTTSVSNETNNFNDFLMKMDNPVSTNDQSFYLNDPFSQTYKSHYLPQPSNQANYPHVFDVPRYWNHNRSDSICSSIGDFMNTERYPLFLNNNIQNVPSKKDQYVENDTDIFQNFINWENTEGYTDAQVVARGTVSKTSKVTQLNKNILAERRKRNTEAARRSRERKEKYLSNLQKQLEVSQTIVKQLEEQVTALELERLCWSKSE